MINILEFYDDISISKPGSLLLWRPSDTLSKIIIEADLLHTRKEFVFAYDVFINLNSMANPNYEPIFHDSYSSKTLYDLACSAFNKEIPILKFYKENVFPIIEKRLSKHIYIKGSFGEFNINYD